MSAPDSDLGSLLDTLARIQAVLPAGEDQYRSDPAIRLNLQRLWTETVNWVEDHHAELRNLR